MKDVSFAIIIVLVLMVSTLEIISTIILHSTKTVEPIEIRNQWGQKPEDAKNAYEWLMDW